MQDESRFQFDVEEAMEMDKKQHDVDSLEVVKVFYRDKQAGMYYARLVGNCSVVLRHGAISFPVGTALTIQFRQLAKRKFTRKQTKATVRHNTTSGMLLSLQSAI
jgi:hypothetical protein